MALHFRRPHRSRTGVPCSTSNSDSESISRCLSDPNLSPNSDQTSQVVHCLIVFQTYTNWIFNNSKSIQVWPNRTLSRHYSIYRGNKALLLLTLKQAEWSEHFGQCLPNPTSSAIPLTKLALPSSKKHTATVVCQKLNHSTTHIVPLHPLARYLPTLHGPESTWK
jgi:hypothetical protein